MEPSRKIERKQFYKMLIAIAVPVAFQNLLATTGSMVDTVMLARLGENTVGAIGLCAQFSSLMFSCYWGFVGGGMLFMSQRWGAKDGDGVCSAHGMTFSFLFMVGLIFGILAFAFPGMVMSMYTDKEVLRDIGGQYLRIVGFAYPLQVASMAISALLRSTERVRLPLIASVASIFTNILFNYLLIFGKLGLPCMGVRGAALATVISAVVNLAVLMILGKVQKHPYLWKFRAHFRWTKRDFKDYLAKCFPIICNELLIGVGNMVINIVLGRQSTQAIAALAVFRTFEGFVISFFAGFTNAASILIGKEVGAGNHELAFTRAKRLILLTPCVVLAACLIFLCFLKPFLNVMSLTGEAASICRYLILLYTLIVPIRMTNWINNDSFRAAGNPIFGTVLEIIFMYALVLPAVILSGVVFHAPFLIVFVCTFCDEPIRVFIILREMLSGRWIRPVTPEGQRTIGTFREAHHIQVKERG